MRTAKTLDFFAFFETHKEDLTAILNYIGENFQPTELNEDWLDNQNEIYLDNRSGDYVDITTGDWLRLEGLTTRLLEEVIPQDLLDQMGKNWAEANDRVVKDEDTSPEDIFSEGELETWAEENGYIKEI